MRYIIIFLLFFRTFYSEGQIVFQYDQSIPVSVNGGDLSMPWVGGINSAQYNAMDLDGDGVEDLMIFDRTTNKVSTYLAEESAYIYAPDYEAYFPDGMTNWVILRDYDCDGKKDIFTSSPFGITAYRNIGTGAELEWEVSIDPITTLGTGSIINIKVNGSDIPAIEDVDGDGDLDILMFGFNGGGIQYHQNFSIERTGSCATPDYERITTSWGDFKECGCGTFVFKGESCRPSGGRQLHVGGKSLLVYDMDNDGDMEVVIGEEDCNTLYLFENEGSAISPVINSSRLFPNSTNPASFVSFPAAFLLDVNFDGKKDLLVSPNRSANSPFTPTNFEESSWFYNNIGSNNIPDFQFSSSDILQSEMIDHGNHASLAFADEDGDGDLDMFITSQGSLQVLGYVSTLSLYRNIGTVSTPEFVLENEDYLGLSVAQLREMKLQITDINEDGAEDLVFAATQIASNTHSIFYLLNKNQNRLDFSGQSVQSLDFQLFSYENPYLFDVNRDGRIDLLIGRRDGNLSYFKNVGTDASPDFQLETDTFYDIDDSFTNHNLVPTVADLDGDGNAELITTGSSGQLTIYQNFMSHLEFPLEGEVDNYFNALTESIDKFQLGIGVLPTTADLYNSRTPQIFLGTTQGGVQVLKNTEALPPKSGNPQGSLSVFPNPGTSNVNDGIIEIASQEGLSVRIISVSGKEVYSSLSVTSNETLKLSVKTLPSGMYIAIGERDGVIIDEAKFIVTD